MLSVHLADVGPRRALGLLVRGAPSAPGLSHAELTTLAPLGGALLPAPRPGRLGLIAAWQDEPSLDHFLERHPLAAALSDGWRVRLQPTHAYGSWPELPGVGEPAVAMSDDDPVAVLTLGRLRPAQTLRFLRASAGAERLAIDSPALLMSTGLARPPRLVATFSLWRTVGEMRAYASGRAGDGHRAASAAHRERPFHTASAFLRFRPYRAEGRWEGDRPLAASTTATPG